MQEATRRDPGFRFGFFTLLYLIAISIAFGWLDECHRHG